MPVCGCEPVEKEEKISKRQPYVPFYTQMLLKGDVEEVLDSTYQEFITTERFIFDEGHNVIHYYLNEGGDEDDFGECLSLLFLRCTSLMPFISVRGHGRRRGIL